MIKISFIPTGLHIRHLLLQPGSKVRHPPKNGKLWSLEQIFNILAEVAVFNEQKRDRCKGLLTIVPARIQAAPKLVSPTKMC